MYGLANLALMSLITIPRIHQMLMFVWVAQAYAYCIIKDKHP